MEFLFISFIIINILAGCGKFTFWAWLAYEKYHGSNWITSTLMFFFLFLGIEQAAIIYVLFQLLQKMAVSPWFIGIGIVNSIFLIASMMAMIVLLLGMNKE
ncbi:MAG: hypothetical protein GF334_03820 [Candidatus Altiarchaeales archaeon]|nr:hypothetical protein [Candidatus Altiarchaeales archaeon]